MDVLLVAFRYLVARPITLVSTMSVMVGLVAIVVVDSVMNGFLAEQRATIRGIAPDVAVRLPTRDPPPLDEVVADVRATPGVSHVAQRVEVPALHRRPDVSTRQLGLAGFNRYYFVQVVGIDVESEKQVIGLDHFLDHSHCAHRREARLADSERCRYEVARRDDPFWFDAHDPHWVERVDPQFRNYDAVPIVFGERLALSFDLEIGDMLTLATWSAAADANGQHRVRSRNFVFVGSFVTRDFQYDVTHALAPRQAAAEFAGLEVPAQELAVAGAEDLADSDLRDRLRDALAPRRIAAEDVQTWADRRSLLLRAVESERRNMNVAMFFVVIVATFSLFMTLHQMVQQKVRDVGVLASLGAAPLRVGQVFLACGLMVTAAGAALGFGCGLLLTRFLNDLLDAIAALTGLHLFDPRFYSFDRLPTRVDLGRIGWYVLATIVCGTLFTLLPSVHAARLDPVEALRSE